MKMSSVSATTVHMYYGRSGLSINISCVCIAIHSQVLKVFIDNPFSIPLMKQQSPIRCLDLSARSVYYI